MPDPTPDLAELRRLLREATPGPFTVYDANEGDGFPNRPLWCVKNAAFDSAREEDENLGFDCDIHFGYKADAALIVALRNSAEALLDRVERAERVAEKAREYRQTFHAIGGNAVQREAQYAIQEALDAALAEFEAGKKP